MHSINNTWNDFLTKEMQKDYFVQLEAFLEEEYNNKTIYPPKENIFRALELTPLDEVKVLILGQDPYHEKGQANGLSFSVNRGIKIPPSLVNIYEELNNDIGMNIPNHGDLSSWASQGVLLLNNVLTVREGKADSHKNKGWEEFTLNIIKALNESETPVVFILWGSKAAKKKEFITNPNHQIITGVHPSPLSAYRGFFGSKPFSQTNNFLVKNNMNPINWNSLNEENKK